MRKNRLFMKSFLCLTLSASMVLSGLAMPETAWGGGGALADSDADLVLDELMLDDADTAVTESFSDVQDELSDELSEDEEVLDELTSSPAADPAAAEADQDKKDAATSEADQNTRDAAAPAEGSNDGSEIPERLWKSKKDKADLESLDDLTSGTVKKSGRKNSDYLRNEFEIKEFGANENSANVKYKKILTQQTDELLTYNKTGEKGVLHIDCDVPVRGSSIKDVWAEMLCAAMSKDVGTDSNGNNYPKLKGAYFTDVYYGDTPKQAFEKAVEKDRYLSEEGVTDPKTNIKMAWESGDHNKAYVRSMIRWGYNLGQDNHYTVYGDITANRYPESSTQSQHPCLCMIVINNADYLNGNFENKPFINKPYIYVLFFHDFGYEDRQEDYLASDISKLEEGDTIDDLKKKGIECSEKVSSVDNESQNKADILVAANNTNAPATVTSSYAVVETTTKSVTQEKESTTGYTQQASVEVNTSFELETGALIEKVKNTFGISVTELNEWRWDWRSMTGTTEEQAKEVSYNKEISQEMPPYTKNRITIQPTETTVTFDYDSAISPTYKVDVLLYNPYLDIQGMSLIGDENAKRHYLYGYDENDVLYYSAWPVANLINTDNWQDITVNGENGLFQKAIVDYPKTGNANCAWAEDIVDNGDHQASLLLGNLRFCRPTLPTGGKLTITQKGIKFSISDYEPSLPLSIVLPSVSRIDLNEGEVYDMRDLTVEGLNAKGGTFYNFNEKTSGEWSVKEGPVELIKNKANNLELRPTGLGEAVLQYLPTHIDPQYKSQALETGGIKGIIVSVIASDGSDAEAGSVGLDNLKWSFEGKKTHTIAGVKKVDVSEKLEDLENAEGYVKDAKHRYKIDNKKAAKIDKNGVLKLKKAGDINIQLEQKEPGGKWTKIGDPVNLKVQVPKMQKKDTKILTEGETIDAFQYLAKTTFRPTSWISTKPEVASVDPETGIITAHKKGTTKIIAVYGEGSEASGKKYATTLKVKMNKNKK